MVNRTTGSGKRNSSKPLARYSLSLLGGLLLLFIAFGTAQAREDWPHIVASKDGTPISYEVHGAGEPALVFVHGWSCDARYWRAQVPYFTKTHHVVIVDLAGHGHSGLTRSVYTMKAFGEDVRAVTEATDSRRVVLIGHSMGGSVIAEAARLMPDRVIGLIGVDTLENIEYPLTRAEFDQMLAPFKKNFAAAARQFVQEMLYPDTDPGIREWILADMASAPPDVALSAMNEMMAQYISGEAAGIFDHIRIPVISVNGDLWPIDHAANRRHMLSYEAIVLKGADHFLMIDRAGEFNKALEKAVTIISRKK
jgi:pimeloyl-ACP methyl ester carboxylesterase